VDRAGVAVVGAEHLLDTVPRELRGLRVDLDRGRGSGRVELGPELLVAGLHARTPDIVLGTGVPAATPQVVLVGGVGGLGLGSGDTISPSGAEVVPSTDEEHL